MSTDNKFHHHEFLPTVAGQDVIQVTAKDISYGASWKRRGGVGAFMMLARKWDRLDAMLSGDWKYDVFEAIQFQGQGHDDDVPQGADGTVLAEIRDLRRYLLLVEAECAARGWVTYQGPEPFPKGESTTVATQREMANAAGGNYATERLEATETEAPRKSMAPWVVDRDFFHRSEIDETLAQRFWRPLGPPHEISTRYALEPYVESRQIPRLLQGVYDMRAGDGLVLRVSRCPTEAREHFPRLRLEVNSHELDALPRWQRPLYVYDDPGTKWVLAGNHLSWGPEL